MATSLADPDSLPANPLRLLESARAVETAVGVAVGFVVAGIVSYLFQHVVQFRSGVVRGQLWEWCPSEPGLQPVRDAQVVAVGSAGPGAGAVFLTATDGFSYSLTMPPGVYALAVILAGGRQVPAMVLTPKTAAGTVQVPSSLELVYDVSAQVLVPENGSVTVDLVTSC